MVAREALLNAVKDTVWRFDKDAEVLLFGSRARGDAAPGSDWDLLVLLEKALTWEEREPILDGLYDLELEAGVVLVPIVMSKQDWASPGRRNTPFHQQVTREGVQVL